MMILATDRLIPENVVSAPRFRRISQMRNASGGVKMTFAPGLKRAETAAEMIERLSMPIPMCGCYAWLGGLNEKGYGKIHPRGLTKGMTSQAHKLAWELKNGPVPDGLELDHLCRQHWCVNPDHLEPVTHAENIRRAWENYIPKDFCDAGHPMRVREDGTRFCHECKLKYQREWRAEQREKQGLPPAASHKGQRKFVCDKCGGPYEVLAIIKDRGPRYGCRSCHQEYYRNRYKRLAVESK